MTSQSLFEVTVKQIDKLPPWDHASKMSEDYVEVWLMLDRVHEWYLTVDQTKFMGRGATSCADYLGCQFSKSLATAVDWMRERDRLGLDLNPYSDLRWRAFKKHYGDKQCTSLS